MGQFLTKNGLSHVWLTLKSKLNAKVDKVDGKQLSTNDYTTAEKNKLAGLSNYSHPTSAGNKHIPAGGAAGKILGWASDGTAQWVDDKDTTYNDVTQSAHGLMTAADKTKLDGIAAGANKYIHPSYTAAAAGLYKVTVDASGHVSATTAVAKSDITALGISSTNTTYSAATTSSSGLMSSSDKSKLDGIATGANKTVVDNALSQVSANPVANSAITKRLQYLYSFKISRDKWNESSDKSNWNVIVPWSDSKGNAITATASSATPNLTTGMSLGPAMMERTSSLSDNIILSGELSMINQGQIYVCDTNKLSFTVKRRPVCDLMLYFYARQWTT